MNNKCILAYGLSDEEFDKIQKRKIRIKKITNNEAKMKLSDILSGVNADNHYDELPLGEKALIFNDYSDKELRGEIKFIRGFITGGVLAIVTKQSITWTFKYLLEHLLEERQVYESQKKGGN